MSYAVAAKALKRDVVLDAAGELMRTRSWADVTMSDVADLAGVSRQTLYNEFGDRQGLAQAYVLRAGEAFLLSVGDAIARNAGDPRAALADAFETFLRAAGDHPVIRAIASGPGGDELLELVTTQGAPVVDFAIDRLAAVLTDGWPRLTGAGRHASRRRAGPAGHQSRRAAGRQPDGDRRCARGCARPAPRRALPAGPGALATPRRF